LILTIEDLERVLALFDLRVEISGMNVRSIFQTISRKK